MLIQGIIPDNLSDLSLIITNDGLWFHNTSNKEEIVYELYTLNYQKGSKNDLINEYNEKTYCDKKYGILHFMEDIFHRDVENSAIVIVPTDLGCHSCASSISKFYVDNNYLFKGKKLYFVVAGLAEFTVDPFIIQNNLKKDMPNLFIDKRGSHLNYFETFNNPRLFIVENNKIIYDKVYKPAELINLELRIKEYSMKN